MALVGLFCADEAARRELALAIEEMGHRVDVAWAPGDLIELVEKGRPHILMVAAGPGDRTPEALLAEVELSSPLLPVVVALSKRDAARAVDLLRLGAAEVAAPPWTRENLSAIVSKALRLRGTAFEAVRPAQHNRRAVFYLAAAVFLGVSFWYVALARRRRAAEEARKPAPPREWVLPYYHPSGLMWYKGALWAADWYTQVVYRHDPQSLAVERTVALPTETPVAVTMVGDAIYVVSSDGQVFRHMIDDPVPAMKRYPARWPATVAVAYDGLYLWTLDAGKKRLRQHLLDDDLTVLNLYDYPSVKPAALAWDGKRLWSVDAAEREILQHDLEDPRRVSYRLPLQEYRSGAWRPTGLAWDGASFWTAAEATGKEAAGRLFKHAVPERVAAPAHAP